ncbi:hypothetical protein AUK40_06600 [Candidatus Wirthbacteria bacterium CG2_30_54_11]|uniref:Amidohydrolase-related domain-containing protein n=1 Tax=Candidatus Wirthbacteria bacterium CG2_30_54_11 TaxID=1817892 RepID=A0A1J5IUJ6_9BACT|nr:MAG: hypothetical protein AUK40_06600 [Candidatus Wirthbacteria bacterium CG2_30_54_11]
MPLLLKNANVFFENRLQRLDLRTRDGKIAEVAADLQPSSTDQVIDLSGKTILPGVIDLHVHFRVPGGEHKEDWTTGSRAAAKGGITAVCDMPNTNPSTTTIDLLRQKIQPTGQASLVNFGINFGAGPDNRAEQRALPLNIPVKCYVGPTTGTLIVDEQAVLEDIFTATDHLFLIHAEDKTEIDRLTAIFKNQNDPHLHGQIRPPKVAAIATQRVLNLARRYDRRVHFCHISSIEELELIRAARAEGLRVTCEVLPHTLFLDETAIDALGNFGKVNPPLRSSQHRKALWQALVNGEIDTVATDHAPHTREEKEKGYWEAPSGVPGVETMLPLLLDQLNKGSISLPRLVEVTSTSPARLLGLTDKGAIAPGFDADLTVIDLQETHTFTDDEIISKCGWTPFAGMTVTGMPVMTVVKGEIMFDAGLFSSGERGAPLWIV